MWVLIGTQEGGDSRPLPVLLILTLPMAGQQGEPVLRYRSVRLYLPPPSFNRDGCAYRINVRGICYVATGLGIHPRKCMQHTNEVPLNWYHSTNETAKVAHERSPLRRIGRSPRRAHSRPLTLRNRASTHPWRECPSPPRPSGEWLPWAEGFQAVSSN